MLLDSKGKSVFRVPTDSMEYIERDYMSDQEQENMKKFDDSRKITDANLEQVGGDHYKVGGEEHWDRAWRLNYNIFQYIITKWAERCGKKGTLDDAIEDTRKIQHAARKWEENLLEQRHQMNVKAEAEEAGPGPEYVNQD